MEPDRRARPGTGAALAGPAPELLLLGTPREVLARIVPEDALGLRPRLATRLVERALLLDVERVLLRAQALCALHGARWRGEPELACWLEQRVEEALAAVLGEEAAALEDGAAPALEPFARPLALDPRALGRACAGFNRLAREQREAFVALVLEARAPDHLASRQGVSLSELARRARSALELFRSAFRDGPGPAPPEGSALPRRA